MKIDRLDCVSVCIGYSDFLAEAAIYNTPLLNRWVIVTSPDDHATRAVCRRFGLECILTKEKTRDGSFSKGRLIDRALSSLTLDRWTIHLDADTVLPGDLYHCLEDAHLDKENIYGCDRLNVVGSEAWDRVRSRGLLARDGHWMVGLTRPDCTLGARVGNRGHGYAPIGFFQLFHGSAVHEAGGPIRRYPISDGTAAHSDVGFAQAWDRRARVLIPELVVWHIDSESCPMGTNWKGRKTKPFRNGGADTAVFSKNENMTGSEAQHSY